MPSFPLQLEKHVAITRTLTLLSGTRIGGSKEELEIGGTDNPVIRDPVTKEPYIPGSSIKGKLRSLLEYSYGKQGQDGSPCGCAQAECPVCTLFGPHLARIRREDREATERRAQTLGPSRLIVRDAVLTPDSRNVLAKLKEEGLPMVEVKTEVTIDRRTGMAARGPLRTQERVPRDTRFALNMSLRVFKGDDEKQYLGWIEESLELLQKDALGGSGTRGYGWVKIE